MSAATLPDIGFQFKVGLPKPAADPPAAQLQRRLQQSWSLQETTREPSTLLSRQSQSAAMVQYKPMTNCAAVRREILAKIFLDLQARQMTTAGNVNAATTAFLCPVTDDDPRAREKLGVILQIVRGQHMTVSDEDMVEALQLVESTADDLPTPQSTHLYYIRSWTLSTAELRHIIQVWEDEDIRPPDAWAWLGRVICRDDSDLCYMRYVGTTKGTTPFLRFMDDQSERTGGMLSDFQAALMEASPEAYAAGKTYTMSSATLSIIAPAPAPAPAPASAPAVPLLVCCHPGDRERFLIAFFGLDYLLNVQTGGFYPSYLPSPTDRDLFAALNTAFFPTMEAQAQPIDADTAGRLATWANSVQQDSEDHPVETGCGMYPMTDEKISVMLDQATPHQLNGHTVVALIGKDITREDYFQPKTFLSGSSRAGFLTRDLLARYQATETNTALMPSLLPAIFLPFCDLFPWLSHKELLLAIAQLHRYLILVKPLVTVTFSRLVTSVLRANCKHAYGCSTRRFLLREVGIPVIQEYSPRDWLANNQLSAPPAGYATIVIPHIHPGRDKYGFQPAELRRVLDLTWMITMHTMSEATRLVSTNVTATHDALVTGVFDALAPGVSAPFDAVVAELDKAKKALHQLWEKERANRRRTMTPLGDLGLRRLRAEERMERGEVAVGIRGSSERETQLWTLWKLDLPDLKIHMDPPVQRRAWMMWAREVKEGKHYFAVALHDSANRGDLDPLRHILAAFAPEGTVPGDNTWMEDPALRKAALKAKSRDMMNKSPADHLKWAKQRARCLKGLQDSPEYEFRSVMEGRQVKITSSGKLRLYWKEDNKDVSILLSTRVPTSAVPVREADKRFLTFLPGGIGLRDQHGAVITFPGRDYSTGFLPCTRFGTETEHARIQKMWDAERARLGTVSVPTVPLNVFMGRPMFQAPLKNQGDKFTLPIVDADAIALMKAWLDSEYPYEGTLTVTAQWQGVSTLFAARAPGPACSSFLSDFLTASVEHRSG